MSFCPDISYTPWVRSAGRPGYTTRLSLRRYQTVPDNRLLLHPRSPHFAPTSAAVIAALGAIGLIGEPFEFAGRRHYRPGEEFLSLITFLGCSPVVALGAPGATGSEFCHVAVHGPHAASRLLVGRNTKPPRCRGCRQPVEEWPELVAADHYTCGGCGRTAAVAELDWRQCAGAGRLFVEVWGIFEGEAVPGDALLAALGRVGGGEWGYFYLRD